MKSILSALVLPIVACVIYVFIGINDDARTARYREVEILKSQGISEAEILTIAKGDLGEKAHTTFKKDSYDWNTGTLEESTFIMSEDGQYIWKFEDRYFNTQKGCEFFKLEKEHPSDEFHKECKQRHIFAYHRWYFVRSDWVKDTRFESQYTHISEFDCSLGKVPLTNAAFFGVYRGHRDNRLCPFDWKNENKNGYGNLMMITPKLPQMYIVLGWHSSAGLLCLVFTTILLVQHRSSPFNNNEELLQCFAGKALKYAVLNFLFTVPVLFVVFYWEPFCKTYVLSKTFGRLDGGVGNFCIFLGVPLKIFLRFWKVGPETAAKISRGYSRMACSLFPLITVFMFVTKLGSKLFYDVVVFAALCGGSLPFFVFNAKHVFVTADDFDDDVPIINLIHSFVFAFHNFLAIVTLGVANNIPFFVPSIIWWNAWMLAGSFICFHAYYLHPNPKVTILEMLKGL